MRALVVILALGMLVAACGNDDDSDQSEPAAATTPETAFEADPPEVDGRPVVLVTDFGIGLTGGWRAGPSDVDDAMALALAMAEPELSVVGLAITMGNSTVGPEARVATPGFLEAAGWELPVFEASQRPIDRPTATFDGEELTDTCVTPGTRALADLLRRFDDVAVLGIGPLSPLACVALAEPDALETVTDVVVLMGIEPDTPLQIDGKNLSDFNFGVDVGAAQVVFEQTELPITLITFETSSASLVTTDQIASIGAAGDLGAYFADQSQAWVDNWVKTFDEDGIHPWDANTVRWLTHPDDYSCAETGFSITFDSDDKPGSAIDDTNAHLYVGDQYDSRPVTACTGYADDAAEQRFVDAVVASLSRG